jgi:two-component system chemotaxis sensor kinase CheA
MDRELIGLLIGEMEGRLASIDAAQEIDRRRTVRHALHAIKGAAGMAGARELAARCGRLEEELDGADGNDLEVVSALREALARLQSGGALSQWPRPEPDLCARPIDAAIAPHYAVEVGERLAAIDEILQQPSKENSYEDYDALFRHIHTLKGAASAAGDDPLAWFCHGLEDALCMLPSTLEAPLVSPEARALLARFRPVLAGLVAAPNATLDALRGRVSVAGPTVSRPRDTPVPLGEMPDFATTSLAPDTVRVSLAALESLSQTLASVARDRDRALRAAASGLGAARRLRQLRGELAEALRLIGPPRPWGAPAAAIERVRVVAEALGRASSTIETDAWYTRTADADFRTRVATGLRTLSDLERVPASGLFARFRQTVDAEARRMGKPVRVLLTGGDELIERRLFEALQESLLQLARNALAHGVETAEARIAAGKDPTSLIRIEAARRPDGSGERLVIAVSDDGPGVNVDALRARAEELGYEGPFDDITRLLRLLLLPGVSTVDGAEGEAWLAGRGVGLDVVNATARALGGELFLSTARGRGFRVEISVPTETTFLTALLVESAGYTFAIPAAAVLAVHLPATGGPVRSRPPANLLTTASRETAGPLPQGPVRSRPPANLLTTASRETETGPRPRNIAEILGLSPPVAAPSELSPRARVLELGAAGARVWVAVDAVLGVENGGARPLGHLLAAQGPYAAVFLGGADLPWPLIDVDAFLVLASRRSPRPRTEPPPAFPL